MTTVLITGATDGLGRALADRLAADDVFLILHGRDFGRLAATTDAIRDKLGVERPATLFADFSDLDQVRRMGHEVRSLTDRVDVLVNNVGIGSGEPDGRGRRVSVNGYELRFAVNYLAGFLLTLQMLPLLRSSAPARVVNVASIGQQAIDFDDLMLEHSYDGMRAYAQSKLAQIMSGFEFARRVPASEVTFNSLHPATYMPTKMVMSEIGYNIDTIDVGVQSTYRLVTSPALDGVSGKFFDRTHEARANAQAYDDAARAELWRRSLKLVDAAFT